jgi:hypothetical protein
MAAKKKPAKKLDAATDRLYKAVDNYVRAKGGSLIVIGGIQIQEWPGDPAMVFQVAVKCMGRKPAYSESSTVHGQEPKA